MKKDNFYTLKYFHLQNYKDILNYKRGWEMNSRPLGE